ncbi:MAG: GntR family transcriptional regulator [Armatimonadetes bacterium]|nr:GntR family transcriptional regulator [Armatimonadota bacterium]
MKKAQARKRAAGMQDNSTLGDSAYRTIREWILERLIKPGDALVEGNLASQLGMSRTPVREALRRLEQEGLLNAIPGKGFFVDSLSPADLAEIYDLREVVEGLAARLLARRIMPEQAEKLKELAAKADDESATINDEIAFHSAVVEMCGNHRVAEAVRLFCLHVFTYDERLHRLTSDGRIVIPGEGRIANAHSELAEKIISRNAAEAEDEARRHVRTGRKTAAKLLLGIHDD